MKFLEAVMDRRDDDCNILRCVLWLLGLGDDRLVSPMANTMDEESQVAVQPVQVVSTSGARKPERKGAKTPINWELIVPNYDVEDKPKPGRREEVRGWGYDLD